MYVLESSRRAPGVYERKVVMHARGEEIMQVCWGCRRGRRTRSRWSLQSQALAFPCRPPIATHPPLSLRPPAEQARSMVYITDEAWLDATERQQVMGR